MKKNTLIRSIAIIGVLMFASPLFAATTVSLSPATINVVPGQKFNVVVTVNPSGTNNYAEKIELNYPKDVLEVNSFTFANTWIPLTQSGYDINTDGVLIKTAGYPAGINGSTVFGTVSFTAKKTGTGTIKIGSSSLAFEVSSQTAITGAGSSFTVASPVVTPKKEEKKKEEVKTPKKEDKKEFSETTKKPEQANSEQNQNQNLAAVVGSATTTESNSKLPFTAGIIVVVGIIGGVIMWLRKGKNQ